MNEFNSLKYSLNMTTEEALQSIIKNDSFNQLLRTAIISAIKPLQQSMNEMIRKSIKNYTNAIVESYSSYIKEHLSDLNATIIQNYSFDRINSLFKALASVNEQSPTKVVIHDIKQTQSVLKEIRTSMPLSFNEDYDSLSKTLETHPLKPLSPKIEQKINISVDSANTFVEITESLNSIETKDSDNSIAKDTMQNVNKVIKFSSQKVETSSSAEKIFKLTAEDLHNIFVTAIGGAAGTGLFAGLLYLYHLLH